MRTELLGSSLLALVTASSASAITMAWTPIGNPGNACDPQSNGCYGAVGYDYSVGTYEVTNAQYAEFLNAKAASDPLGLYDINMGLNAIWGGITQDCASGTCRYAAKPDFAEKPVVYVQFYDALRFANWMNNGQGNGDTETGAYTLLGGTPTPSNGTAVTRNPGVNIFLTSEDEWYKAAYYDPVSASYFDYPTGTNIRTSCAAPVFDTGNTANCLSDRLTNVGAYRLSESPYGTFDQGGNVMEWNETIFGENRGYRGGCHACLPSLLAAAVRGNTDPRVFDSVLGFRVAMIPEPSTGLLVIAGLVGLAVWRRVRD